MFSTNKNRISRLSGYKKTLRRLKALGFVKVFSDNIADSNGVTSSQVRKDFSLFGITGNKRGGYNIDQLVKKLDEILGKTEDLNVVVVGVGKIGSALINYKGFEREKIKIVAGFDIDVVKFSNKNTENDIPIFAISELQDYIANNSIKIAIIAVPEVAAEQVYHMLLNGGIKGILNFAPIQLQNNDEVIVNNINLELELENLFYFINEVDSK